MAIKIYKVDAFSDKPFSGNPAAVCILDSEKPKEWMQGVAREMNLSETAFLVSKGDGLFGLRWFTPATEVKLCGHATLASAHVLYETGAVPKTKEIRFNTLSGILTANKNSEWIELVFPNQMGREVSAPEDLDRALGAKPIYVGVNELLYYLVELGSEKEVRELKPNIDLLKRISVKNGKIVISGVIVTAKSDGNYDFVSRFFCPAVGIDEDPVTGSAHCFLGPFWKQRLNKRDLLAYQASSRGGVLRVTVEKDKVKISGKAVTILEGILEI